MASRRARNRRQIPDIATEKDKETTEVINGASDELSNASYGLSSSSNSSQSLSQSESQPSLLLENESTSQVEVSTESKRKLEKSEDEVDDAVFMQPKIPKLTIDFAQSDNVENETQHESIAETRKKRLIHMQSMLEAQPVSNNPTSSSRVNYPSQVPI